MIMSLDRALSGNPFAVDDFRCSEAAAVVRGARLSIVSQPWNNWPTVRQLEFKLLFISICHQINWDYLQSKLFDAWKDLDFPISRSLSDVTARSVKAWLSDYARPERVRAEERAKILRETAESVAVLVNTGALERMVSAPIRLEGPTGVNSIIRAIPVFQTDPHLKKLNVFVHEVFLEKVVQVLDPENLMPAIDYHLIRLYLRTGRVYPTAQEVAPFLLGEARNPRARLVQTLRAAVVEAARQTAFYADVDIATLNNIEWQLGRSICTREDPSCETALREGVLTTLRATNDRGCPYAEFCRSRTDSAYGYFSEPDFEKTFF
jgi:hypothetical protein